MVLLGLLLFVFLISFNNFIPKEKVVGSLNYEIIDLNQVNDQNLLDWLEENKVSQGIFTKDISDSTYILLSTGKQDGGDYNIEINSLIADEENIYIDGNITHQAYVSGFYPVILLKIKEDTRNINLKNFSLDLESASNPVEIGIIKNITDTSLEILNTRDFTFRTFILSKEILNTINAEKIDIDGLVIFEFKSSKILNIMKVNSFNVVGKYTALDTTDNMLFLDIKGKSISFKYDPSLEDVFLGIGDDRYLVLNVQNVNGELLITELL